MINYNKHSNSYRLFLQLALALIVFLPAVALAQGTNDRVTVNLTDPARPVMLHASLLNGSITVKGGPGKDVVVDAHVRGHETSHTEGGMKRIPMNSTGLSVEEENNQVDIKADAIQRTIDLTITTPRNTSVVLKTVNDGNIVVSDVEGEIDVNDVNGAVTLSNVAGSAVAHALNGRILVSFTRVDQKSMAFSSLNGDIDVSFPADLKANVSFQTDNGEVFSDFDVQLVAGPARQVTEDRHSTGGRYRVHIDKTVRGTINGGGPEIQFKNFNGNIYVRKAGAPK